MNVLIVEDEHIAASKLKSLLSQVEPDFNVIGNTKSIAESIVLIQSGAKIDVAFFDIQLEDGLSFSILEQVDARFPVIFTTAYDDYAIRAFDHHSIAYLLKPIQKKDLEKALQKFRTIQPERTDTAVLLEAIKEARKTQYKERFTVKVGDKIRLFEVGEVACFFSRDKGSFLCTNSGKFYSVDQPIDSIENLVDPEKFFRINRKHLIQLSAIGKMVQYTNSRLKVELKCPFDEDLIVAREKVRAFKEWLEG